VTADPGVPVLGHKGASVHVRELAEALVAAGARVTIASPRVEPEGDRLAASVGLVQIPPVLPLEHGSETTLRAAMLAQRLVLMRLARDLGVDAVYERYSLFSDAGVVVAGALDLPHILEVNAPLRAEAEQFRTLPHAVLAARVERDVFERTDRIFVVSEALAGLMPGSVAAKVEVVPNAVAPAKFAPRHARTDDSFVAGFAGSLKPWHGVDVLVDAARMALDEEPRLRIEIVGAGPMAALFDNVPAHRCAWLGPLPHAATIQRMRGWDVGLAPYRAVPDFYFSPLKIVEYMALALCPVASALGEIPTLLDGGTHGVLVSADDRAALAEALVDLAAEPKRAHAHGVVARDYVLGTHTWDRNAARVLAALAEIGHQAAA
jgi:glycosyltransferase involved in cell wall biosynthesis